MTGIVYPHGNAMKELRYRFRFDPVNSCCHIVKYNSSDKIQLVNFKRTKGQI